MTSPDRAWHFTRRTGEVMLWARWGSWSLWLDTALGRLEINGAAFTDLFFQREDPLEESGREAWRVFPSEGLEEEAQVTFQQVAAGLQGARSSLGAILAWPILLGLVLVLLAARAFPPWGWGMFLPSLAWVALGARWRGIKGVWFSLVTLGLLASGAAGPYLLRLALVALLLGAPLLGLGRMGRSLAAAGALTFLQGGLGSDAALLRGSLLLGAALGASFLAQRRRRLKLGLNGTARWQAHLMSETLAQMDSSTLWMLDPAEGDSLPPMAARVRSLPWLLGGGLSVYEVVGGGVRWIFLPECVWIQSPGLQPMLVPLRQFTLELASCIWEAAPPALGQEAVVITLTHASGLRRALLFGRGEIGRAFAERFGYWTSRSAKTMDTAAPSSAEALLGVRAGASLAEIKHAYFEAVKRWHPDRHPKATPAERAALEERMRALNEAYAALEFGV